MDMNPRQRALIAIEKLRIVIAMKNIYQIGMGPMMDEREEQMYKFLSEQTDPIADDFAIRAENAMGENDLLAIESEIEVILGFEETKIWSTYLHRVAPGFGNPQ
jgi:hypothetical protein